MTIDILNRTMDRRRNSANAPVLYSASTEPMMREVLQILADIDFEHEQALERLELSETDPDFRRTVAKRLNEQHQIRRDPYVRLLTDLHMRAMPRAVLSH